MEAGNLKTGKKLFLAPMAEVTDSSFRMICKEHGAGLTFTQMVSALGVIKNEFETLRHLSFNRSEKPIGVQVLGNDPDILGEATKEIAKLNPDLIDLNAGCPVEKVCSHSMGAALLDDPQRIGKIIRKMVDSAGSVPVSAKLRLGKDRTKINIIEAVKAVEDNGASLVFVHARARTDKYDTIADWEWIKKVKENIGIPVVGNGSMFTPDDVKNMIEQTGCDSAMIARGALGNPFIFSRYNLLVETGIDPGEPDAAIVLDTILKQIDLLQKEFGEPVALDKAKKHSIWYFRHSCGISFLLEKIFAVKNLNALRSLLSEHTNKNLNGVCNSEANKEIHKKFQKKILFWLAEENAHVLG